MFVRLFSILHYLIGLTLGILLLPLAYSLAFPPLGIALAVIIWPSVFVISCLLGLTSPIWVPALIFGVIALSIISFSLEVASSLIGTFRHVFRQPPQHPQPFYDVPALPSGIPASRSDSVIAGYSRPMTPGADGAADTTVWLERKFSGLVPRSDTADVDDTGSFMMSVGRGPRSYPPRRSSSTVGASSSSVNTGITQYSTTSVNTTFSIGSVTRSIAGPQTPTSPLTPSRRSSRTKSMSFEDGTRPGLAISHSTTSMVAGSPRISSQQEANSSDTSLASMGSAVGSLESLTEPLRMGQLVYEASDDNLARH